MERKIFGMVWNGRFQVWNGIVWKILPAMEDGIFTFHSIVCPACGERSKHFIEGDEPCASLFRIEVSRTLALTKKGLLLLCVHLR